jgi:RNA polymerase sigma-70 factor (ECF subfamily)
MSHSPTPADPQAFYAACYARLVVVLALASGNRADAEEVVQDAFVRLLPRWSTVSQYDDPEAWVRKVAFRLLATRVRRFRTGVRVMARLRPVVMTPGPGPDGVALHEALSALPLTQREVVILPYYVDLPVDAIAAELGVAVATVKSRLSRARAALAPLLSEGITDHA